jgi:AraC-like DNA-binding protein
MKNSRSSPEAAGGEAGREELAERIARIIPGDGMVEPQRGLNFYRFSAPTGPLYGVSQPSLCVIAQGAKEVLLGEDLFRYDPAHYLLASVGLPVSGRVVEASADRPYLALRLILDPAVVASVMVEAGFPSPRGEAGVRGIDVSPLDASLLDTTVRLVRLLDSPEDYRILAPLVTREIVYRLLKGEQADRLRQMTSLGGQTHRIARAVERLRQELDKPLRIESIAKELAMSVSAFHHHFKAVTALSPLQFQKQLRLQEARRLLLAEDLDAAGAGFRVGYEDPSHFTRDYKRQFGEPPMRDVVRLREAVALAR